MEWKRVSEHKPPANTDILVLVRGRVFEGQLDVMRLKNPTSLRAFTRT